jgi:hypothetical protein
MITYRKHFCGIPLLFHGFYGSSFFRALPFPIASTLFAIFLFYERPVELPTGSGRPGIENEPGFATAAYRAPYPFQVGGHRRASLTLIARGSISWWSVLSFMRCHPWPTPRSAAATEISLFAAGLCLHRWVHDRLQDKLQLQPMVGGTS